jgi:LacI family transcriptional regulator
MIEPLGEYIQGLLRGIVKYSNTKRSWILFREPGKHEGILPPLDPSQADGIIAKIPNTPKALSKLPKSVATITIGYRKIISGLPQILGDTTEIGKIAADYFLARGFKNFAYCGFDEMHWSRERGESYRNTIEDQGFNVSFYKNIKKTKKQPWQVELQDIAKWLKSIAHPTAVLACNDERGQHIIHACKIAKLRIPEEIAILGVDNDNFVCGLSTPPLSSIALSVEKAGYQAAELLDKMIRTKKSCEKSVIVRPTHVVTRQSTDILAIEDEQLAEAINFIHKNCNSQISVEDVVDTLALSRRSIERKFRKHLSRSVNEEIRRIRVNNIIKMLLNTDLTITQIGLALAYKDLTHIARYFKEETSITPSQYRKTFSP